MGYGGTRQDAAKAVGGSGDGGIDGVINEDLLGLETVYIQANRWDAPVGRPEVQRFAGALQGTLRFDAVAGSQALRAVYSGCPYYRIAAP